MVHKINVSHKGITKKFETDSEALNDKKIGETVSGTDISQDLEGYEVQITGTSDKSGFPGLEGLQGPGLRKKLLTYGIGMHKRPKGERKKADQPKGLRLRKTVRGNTISEDTVQINTKVTKEGKTKFEEIGKKEEQPAEESKE